MNSKRIGIIHYTLPPGISGVEMVIRDQARLLSSFGYKIFLLGASGKKIRSEIALQLDTSFDPKNKRVLVVQAKLKQKKIDKSFEQLKNKYKSVIRKWIETNNLGIVIVHNILSRHYNLALTAAMVEVSSELHDTVRFITWVHDASFVDTFYTGVNKNLTSIYPWSLLASFQDSFTYVTISKTRKKELLHLYGEDKKIIVIPNGLDINKMLPLPLQTRMLYKDITEKKPSYIGLIPVRIAKRKNIEYAIKFVEKAKQLIDKNFVFIVTGSLHLQNPDAMEYYDYLLKLIKDSNVEENFLFLYKYKLSNGEKFDIYKLNIRDLYLISDFLFLPSKGEGFGLPIIEAGFMRLPIFVSDLPVFKEVGNGYINTFKLEDSIETNVNLITNYLKKSRATLFHKTILKEYSLERIIKDKVIPLLNSV